MLSKSPRFRVQWAPRAMRATLLAPIGNPLIEMTPQSMEGRRHFGDHVTLFAEAGAMLDALKAAEMWLGKLIADGGHARTVSPGHAERTLAEVSAVIARAEGRE